MNLHCPKCGKSKPETAFAESSTRPTGRQYWCRSCKKAYDLELYARDPQRRKAIRRSNMRRERVLAGRVYDYLAKHPCVDCGEPDPLKLELDDPPGRGKPVILTQKVRTGLTGWQAVEKKLNQFEVRCGNCRRLRLRRQFGWFGWSYAELVARKSASQMQPTKKRKS